MLTDAQAKIYEDLVKLSDESTPQVRARCIPRGRLPPTVDGSAAIFATHDDAFNRVKPHILVVRLHCAEGSTLRAPHADLTELISLAHERGHETSWRQGTYVPMTMPEEHRAWKHAEILLQRLGFDEWPAFEGAKRFALSKHQELRTPESEAGADAIRSLAQAMHLEAGAFNTRASDWSDACKRGHDGLVDALHGLGRDRCQRVYEAERYRLSFLT